MSDFWTDLTEYSVEDKYKEQMMFILNNLPVPNKLEYKVGVFELYWYGASGVYCKLDFRERWCQIEHDLSYQFREHNADIDTIQKVLMDLIKKL